MLEKIPGRGRLAETVDAHHRALEADVFAPEVGDARFDRQPDDYKASVLLEDVPRVAVEAGVTGLWRKYVGLEGAVVGLDRFGESAPAGDLFKHFGFTPENVAQAVRSVLR